MNKKLVYFFALLGAMVVFAPSCGDSDPCKDVDCGANGACFDGGCVCDDGYEQDAEGKCTVLTVSKFTGKFSVTEDCSLSNPAGYTATITAGSGVNQVNITNFWGLFQNVVKATVSGNQITIARQEPDNDKFFVQGSGTLGTENGKTVITVTYTVSDETGATPINDVCTNTRYVKL